MTLTAGSSLQDVVEAVGSAFQKAGIRAVLVGGACAAIYSGGDYMSEDLDMILQSAPNQKQLDAAMAAIGFTRRAAQYFTGSPTSSSSSREDRSRSIETFKSRRSF